jgi:hypothetical protein
VADGILASCLKEAPRKGRQAAGRAVAKAIVISFSFHTPSIPIDVEYFYS